MPRLARRLLLPFTVLALVREEEDGDRVAARALSEETEISARCVGGSPSFET